MIRGLRYLTVSINYGMCKGLHLVEYNYMWSEMLMHSCLKLKIENHMTTPINAAWASSGQGTLYRSNEG